MPNSSPTPSTVALRAALRADAVHQFQLAGYALVRIRSRKQLYDCTIGTISFKGWFRTAPRVLVSKASGPDAADPINIEGEHEFVIVSVPGRNGGPTEVYEVPTEHIIRDLRENHRQFVANHPNTAGPIRQIFFDGRPETLGRGYRVHYREFLILPDDNGAAIEQSGDDDGLSPLELALQATAHAASEEYGQPIDHIRISIGVMFRTGEVVFNWGPSLS